jgi:DNA polymerase alpha-associated DNA helicase A
MNVLLSRARQKLVLATSQRFIREVVEGIDPDGMNDELEFLRKMLKELERLAVTDFELVGKGASVVKVDENGKFSP